MICTNCFEAEYKTAKTELTVTVNSESHLLRDLNCETCPACGETTFTHSQSLEIDKKRISLEFGLKPLLTPEQLKTLRRVMDMKLDDICDLLHIGRNTYGRWERGEVAITPSMNLLVHAFIEKLPGVCEQILGNGGAINDSIPKRVNEIIRQRSAYSSRISPKGKLSVSKEAQLVCREDSVKYPETKKVPKETKTRD